MMLTTPLFTLCVLRVAAAMGTRSPQGLTAPSNPSNLGSSLNIAASNDTSVISNTTTSIKIAWDLGENPRTADLALLPIAGVDNATRSAYLNDTILGPLIYGNASTASNLQANNILLISCDDGVYNGSDVSVRQLWVNANNQNVAAVVFVSQFSALCIPTGPLNSGSPHAYTMKLAAESRDLVTASRSATTTNLTNPIRGVIAPTSRLDVNGTMNAFLTGKAANMTPSDSGAPPAYNGNTANNNSGAPSTAVAMIILYSITGVITALFLLVIITGAIRAHRHPERYGPSGNSANGGRQSRAKGLARAMLETLPIVKFTAPEQPAKAEDLEMNTAEPASVVGERDTGSHENDLEKGLVTRSSSRGSATRGAASSVRSGIGPAAPSVTLDTAGAVAAAAATTASPRPNTAATDDNPGCSICTDDFEPGQDLRLLPCGHRFHPACVDPWLLNISGSCPLCRIDLNPDSKDKKRASSTPTLATGGNNDDEQQTRSDSIVVANTDAAPGGALGRTRRLSRLALSRFVGTAPLTGRRRARVRSGPVMNGSYAQANVNSPQDPDSVAPDAFSPGTQDTPTSPSVNNRHSR